MKDTIKKLVEKIKSPWKKAIIAILKKHCPDKVHVQEIYLEIEDYITLTDYDREITRYHEPRYHQCIRANLRQLKDKGIVENVKKGSGYWRYRDC